MSVEFILVGAKPLGEKVNNPGGQLTASLGLIEYAKLKGYNLDIIDTTQSSFPIPPFKDRLIKGFKRVVVLRNKLSVRNINGLIVFSSAGFSFYERILMCFIGRLYGVKSVFFMRDGFFCDAVKSNKVAFLLAKLLLQIPTVIAAQGDGWVRLFQSLGVRNSKIITVRNWLPLGFSIATDVKYGDKKNKIQFVFVGWVVEAKGVYELIEATKQLLQEFDFELVLVGGGTLKEVISKDVELNSFERHIRLTGWQTHSEVLNHLNASHVFILPSKAEGFPNAMLEAMAVGLPVICTDVGAISDSLYDGVNGVLLSECTTYAIKQAMSTYLLCPDIIAKQSAESLAIVQRQHDFKTNCGKLFDQLLG